jgi:hypothetical protein
MYSGERFHTPFAACTTVKPGPAASGASQGRLSLETAEASQHCLGSPRTPAFRQNTHCRLLQAASICLIWRRGPMGLLFDPLFLQCLPTKNTLFTPLLILRLPVT